MPCFLAFCTTILHPTNHFLDKEVFDLLVNIKLNHVTCAREQTFHHKRHELLKSVIDDIYNILRHLFNTYTCVVEINLFVLILVKGA